MIDGRERRAFAPGGDVGRTKVRDHVDLERRRGARAVAELPRKARARPMQDGLAVQADESNAVAGDRMSLKKRLDRRDMGVGHQALKLELRRLGFAQVGDHRAQALSDSRRVGEGRGRPGLELRFAVAFDQRDVDPVHRRAADDADRGRYSLSPRGEGWGEGRSDSPPNRLSLTRFRSDWRRAPTIRPTCRSRWPRARRRTGSRRAG